jgi:hypothetical protein
MPFTDSDGLVKVIERLEALHPSQISEHAAAERALRQAFFLVTRRPLEWPRPVAYDAALSAIEEAFILMRQATEPAAARTDAGNQPQPSALISGGIRPAGGGDANPGGRG